MPNTTADSEAYLDATEFSLSQLFQSFVAHQKTLAELRETLTKIERSKQIQHDVFVDRDQWSVNANYYYGQYIQRLQQLDAQANAIGTTEQEQMDHALVNMGATEESMAVIAGAILQVAKQVLSFRFGSNKRNLPSSRMIGSQSVTEVVWEGRNHAMHWEELEPRPPVIAMLQALTNDLGVQIVPNSNNSWAILAAIGWHSASDGMAELKQLIQ